MPTAAVLEIVVVLAIAAGLAIAVVLVIAAALGIAAVPAIAAALETVAEPVIAVAPGLVIACQAEEEVSVVGAAVAPACRTAAEAAAP